VRYIRTERRSSTSGDISASNLRCNAPIPWPVLLWDQELGDSALNPDQLNGEDRGAAEPQASRDQRGRYLRGGPPADRLRTSGGFDFQDALDQQAPALTCLSFLAIHPADRHRRSPPECFSASSPSSRPSPPQPEGGVNRSNWAPSNVDFGQADADSALLGGGPTSSDTFQGARSVGSTGSRSGFRPRPQPTEYLFPEHPAAKPVPPVRVFTVNPPRPRGESTFNRSARSDRR